MAAPKRTVFQREADYERITSLYLRGWRQVDIAAELGIVQSQVSYDLRVIQDRWKKNSIIDMDEAKQRELSRIDELERECWQAWEDSKKERTKTRQESTGKKKNDGKMEVVRATMERETGAGNPAFLSGVMSCIAERNKLLGLYPTKSEQQKPPELSPPTDLSGLSAEDLDTLERISAKVHDGAR